VVFHRAKIFRILVVLLFFPFSPAVRDPDGGMSALLSQAAEKEKDNRFQREREVGHLISHSADIAPPPGSHRAKRMAKSEDTAPPSELHGRIMPN